MSSKSNVPVLLLICLFLLTIPCLCGCRKTNDIWGTWEETSVRETYTSAGVTMSDTVYYSGRGTLFTFTTGGAYFATGSEGYFRLSGQSLELTDTSDSPPRYTRFRVQTLNDQSLVLQYNDTFPANPSLIIQYIYTLAPH